MPKVLIVCLGLASLSSAASLVTANLAQAQNGDDWPCVQRRTGTISAAAIWSGPDPAQAGAWGDDSEAAALAQKLASRRTPIEDLDGLLDDFAAKARTDKDKRLTRVFAGVLEIVNKERDRILSGISRYARGQKSLAEKVRAEGNAVADAQEAQEKQDQGQQDQEKQEKQTQDMKEGKSLLQRREEAESSLKWDKRIFDERTRSLSYVCEAPVLLERRVFDIARRIQQRL